MKIGIMQGRLLPKIKNQFQALAIKNNGDIDNAVKILKKYSDKSDADLKNVILKIVD